MGYNPEATKFQYDFLNDNYEKLPEGLRKVIEQGREVICLMNPPYGTANDGVGKGATKKGLSDTLVSQKMDHDKMGKSRQQLYNQFIYKLIHMNVFSLCMFTPPLYLSGVSTKIFRTFIFNKMNFNKGFLMDASNFADVKSWGLSFTILSSKK
jgi:hypothetical protein